MIGFSIESRILWATMEIVPTMGGIRIFYQSTNVYNITYQLRGVKVINKKVYRVGVGKIEIIVSEISV